MILPYLLMGTIMTNLVTAKLSLAHLFKSICPFHGLACTITQTTISWKRPELYSYPEGSLRPKFSFRITEIISCCQFTLKRSPISNAAISSVKFNNSYFSFSSSFI